MSSQPATGKPVATSGQQVRKLKAQGAVNRVIRGLLRVPLISTLLGRRLVTLSVVGRTSGRQYVVPVAYTPDEGSLLIGTSFAWGRNLRSGEPLGIRFKGRGRLADVQVLTDEPGVVGAYAVMARDNRNFARFNDIGFDADGNPVVADLHRAWESGARAFRVTPR